MFWDLAQHNNAVLYADPEGLNNYASEINEKQSILCDCDSNCANAGSFKLSFNGETTEAIMANSNHATLKQKLEALSTISSVTISATQTEVCRHGGDNITITFDSILL